MTEFDHLIKNKANEAQYSYKASAWKAFLRKAGLKAGLTTGQIVTIVLAAAVIVGSVSWNLLRAPKITPAPVATASQTDSVTATTVSIAKPMLEPTAEPAQPCSSQNKTVSSTRVANRRGTVDSPAVQTNLQPETRVKERIGRPIHINPDTIKDNLPTDEQLQKGHSRVVSQ